ncbi:hypothetical protein CYY_001212 [Polysphondylium violaceum]|uniref:Exportin-1/Importin-beta-like domain-containing protein n=1 Tax=Polysphondylium violaceum TaxID=133409 RepID=A0A8J4Q087_9MYCE|nr:hypothetical protein CYY_001212 [Polysphondylium violaceum]
MNEQNRGVVSSTNNNDPFKTPQPIIGATPTIQTTPTATTTTTTTTTIPPQPTIPGGGVSSNSNNSNNVGNGDDKPLPSIENISQVLQTLFTHHDANIQNEANRWLIDLQSHPRVVMLCLELIQANHPFYSQFFGIQTLYTRIHSDWESKWDDDFRVKIKDLVFNRFILDKDSNNNVFTSKICSCIAAIMIHSIPRLWDDCITVLLNLFHNNETTEIIKKGILDILYLLPLEFETVVLSNNRRLAIKSEFTKVSESVVQSISEILGKNLSSPLNIILLKCVRNWIRFSNSKSIFKSNLLLHIFQIINNQEVLVECMSLIGDLINFYTYMSPISTSRPANSKDIHSNDHENFQIIIVPIISKIFSLKPIYEQAVQNDEIFICRAFSEVLSQIVECYTPIMLDTNNTAVQQCLSFLLQTCTHPNIEISEITFDAWQFLAEQALVVEQESFQTLYAQLLQVLLEKSSYPSNKPIIDPTSELADSISNYRNNVCDIILSCFELIGYDQSLQFLDGLLKNQCKTWQSYEVVYYAFRCVSSSIVDEDISFDVKKAKDLLEFAFTLPYHLNLSDTILFVLKDFGDFIYTFPDLLSNSINYIISLLKHQPIRADALKILSTYSNNYGDRIYKQIDLINSTIEPLFSILNMSERINFINTVMFLLSFVNHNQAPTILQKLLSPIINEIRTSLSIENYQEQRSFLINTLPVLKTSLSFPENYSMLYKDFVFSIWPLLEDINKISVSNKDVELLGCVWKIYSKITLEMGDSLVNIDQLFNNLLSVIRNFPVVTTQIFEMIDTILNQYGKDTKFHPYFINLIDTLINQSLPILSENNNESIPTVTRFYKTIVKSLEVCPNAFNNSPNLFKIIDYAIIFLLNIERDSVMSIIEFLTQLFIKMNPNESFLSNYSLLILNNTLKALVNDPNRTLIVYLSNFLFNWMEKYSNLPNQQIYIRECFAHSDWLPKGTSLQEKERLSHLILKLTSNKAKFRSLLNDISQVCNNQNTWDIFVSYELY